MSMSSRTHDLLVIGGGAAGLMAALTAAENGAAVTILERNAYVGRKLGITGKGRCNVTNNCGIQELLAGITRNPRFLYSAFTAFPPERTMELFQRLGVPLKTERGRRVFPESDRAADIVNALRFACRDVGVQIRQLRAERLEVKDDAVVAVSGAGERIGCAAAILCTGGASYPVTGSTGDGFRMARELGHTVTELCPSLVPLNCSESLCSELSGLSLRNVTLSVRDGKGKQLFRELGEMLFTHFGVSGPLVLSASTHMRNYESEHFTLHIDLKPGLDEQQLDARILRDFSASPNKELFNTLPALLNKRMVGFVLEKAMIDGTIPVNSVTREQRRRLVAVIKDFCLTVIGPRPIEEAIITSGGVQVKEVNPSTMESKLIKGLYFAGEILDVDAYTGGYNLQIAWSTAFLAGTHAAQSLKSTLKE